MSLIHTAELQQANLFDYLTELQKHAGKVRIHPSRWMPWNYRETLDNLLDRGTSAPEISKRPLKMAENLGYASLPKRHSRT